MAMFMENAFWSNWRKKGEDQSKLTALKIIEPGKTEQIETKKGSKDYDDIIRQIGINKITKNTIQRFDKKFNEENQRKIREEQIQKSKKLEELFSLKLQAFESDYVKNSENKKLRSLIRRSKNKAELNAFTTLLIGVESGIIKLGEDK